MEVPQDCKGCGKCCMLLTAKPLSVYVKETGDPTLPFLEIRCGRCQFLDDNNECIIHDTKPQRCKDGVRGSYRCLESLKSYESNL